MNIGEHTVRECLREATTVTTGATTREVFDLMSGNGGRPVVVVGGDGAPVGIVTEGDLLRRILAIEVPSGVHLRAIVGSLDAALAHIAERRRSHGGRVGDVMSQPLIVVAPSDSVLLAVQLFGAHRIHQLPVVEEGRLVGIVHLHDLTRFVLDRQDEWARQVLGDEPPAATPATDR